MTTAQIFSLIAEIFALSARLEPKSINSLHKYISENFQGDTQHGLLTILKGIEYLQAPSEAPPSHPLAFEEPTESYPSTSTLDSTTREFKAMLLDGIFVPTKSDLVDILKKTFNKDNPVRINNKDSKQELIERSVRYFKSANDAERRQAFQQLRNLYFRNRNSSLEEWSRIITKGK
ncbi:hypothetical protein OV207_21315 [Corallococcus sp. BB11-1]|uniref:hypothetical protein n=1 Tax=Corallococcus sp. BB11-1 TaxID=2996783 RepID=UPI00226D8BB6|nr:hypothetical protein [Corallococcus sp. BB11-1]MCY1034007.1 hypothetical protein [Corallococcus sp. BB11-1]